MHPTNCEIRNFLPTSPLQRTAVDMDYQKIMNKISTTTITEANKVVHTLTAIILEMDIKIRKTEVLMDISTL